MIARRILSNRYARTRALRALESRGHLISSQALPALTMNLRSMTTLGSSSSINIDSSNLIQNQNLSNLNINKTQSRSFHSDSSRSSALRSSSLSNSNINLSLSPSSNFFRLSQPRRNSSFMRRVLDQVQKDLEKNEEYQKAKEDFKSQGGEDSAEKLRQKAKQQEERLKAMSESMGTKTKETTSSFMKAMREQVEKQQQEANRIMEEKKKLLDKQEEDSEFIKQTKSAVGAFGSSLGTGMEKARGVFGSSLEKLSDVVGKFEGEKADSHRRWKEGRESMAKYKESQQSSSDKSKTTTATKAEGESDSTVNTSEANQAQFDATQTQAQSQNQQQQAQTQSQSTAESQSAAEEQNALVLKHESTWDRFGASMRDMPLLHGILENPLFDRLFQETEIAQSIREMKEQILPTFTMIELTEEVEHVIAPAIVRAYLEGDAEFLKLHCGEAAFRAVNASIEERRKGKCELDQDLRVPPSEIALAGARCIDVGGGYSAPVFVFTFHCQQINCLTNIETGEVVEGAFDDIRNVFYAIAVTRHPLTSEDDGVRMEYIRELRKQHGGKGKGKKPESCESADSDENGKEKNDEFSKLDETSLEFPWLISELAVVGNQSVW